MSKSSIEMKRKYEKTLKKVKKEFGIKETKDYNEYLQEENERNNLSFEHFLKKRARKS